MCPVVKPTRKWHFANREQELATGSGKLAVCPTFFRLLYYHRKSGVFSKLQPGGNGKMRSWGFLVKAKSFGVRRYISADCVWRLLRGVFLKMDLVVGLDRGELRALLGACTGAAR